MVKYRRSYDYEFDDEDDDEDEFLEQDTLDSGDKAALAKWVASLEKAINAYPYFLSEKGKTLASRVTEFQVEDLGDLVCTCRDFNGTERYLTVFSEPIGKGANPVMVSCSCDDYVRSYQCMHSYAALVKARDIIKNLLAGSNSQLAQAQKPNPWQHVLAELDRYVAGQQKTEAAAGPKADLRLAWRIVLRKTGIDVTPIEQTLSQKSGKWSKGRKVNWDRLMRTTSLWSTPADERAASYLLQKFGGTTYRRYYYEYDVNYLVLLEHLAGHPRILVSSPQVFEEPYELRIAKAGIALAQTEDGLQLQAALDGRPVQDYGFVMQYHRSGLVALLFSEKQIVVSRIEESMWNLFETVNTFQPIIPADAKDELLSRLPALEQCLPVRLPEQLLGDSVPADPRIHVRLTPSLPAGMIAEIRVRPGSVEQYFPPGEGPEGVTAMDEGKRIRLERNLLDETTRANELLSASPLVIRSPVSPWRWSILDDEGALDLLSFLQTRPQDDPVVEWCESGRGKMAVLGELTPASMRVQIKDRFDWFGIEGTFELAGQQFPLASLLMALRDGRKYVRLDDGQFAVISKEFRDRLAALDDVLHKGRSGLEFNVTAAPVLADLFEDKVTLRATQTWKKTLKRLEEAADIDPHPPISLTAELRDYQLDGYRWLRRLAAWGVGGCLADDMGLGKTVQALAVLIDRMETGPALVVAPTSVGFNWAREAERFAPTLRPILYRDTDRTEFLATLGDGDLVITSYGLLLRHAEELASVKWGTLVLDEAQFIKNSRTKTAQVVRDVKADWRLALTGTPVENHLGELWSIFRAVSPGLFGSWERFRERFAEPIEKKKEPQRRQALARVIRPFVLRRTKSEVLTELPQRTEVQLTAELSEPERKLYEDARLWAVAHLANVAGQNEDHRFQVLAALTRLRQLACHPRLVDASWSAGSAKLELFLETVEELRDGRHRALVFSQFTSHLALLREALDERQIPYQYLDGSTTPKQRQERVDAFQRGEGDLFLISLKAGGTGLNLTAADYVIHMDPWWNPAVEDQATDRTHRIGQTRPVTVYRLVAKDTIEEQILALHSEKRNLVAGVLDGSDQAGKLSSQELMELIRDGGRDAVRPTPPVQERTHAARTS